MTILVHEYVTGGGLAGQGLPGSWAAEGHAMRRGVVEDLATIPGVRVAMTLDRRFADEPGPWEVVRVGDGEELATLARRSARASAVLVIAPETGMILRDRAELCRGAGASWLGSDPTSIALTTSKAALQRHLESRGVRTAGPVAFRGPAGDEGVRAAVDIPFPVVLKPDDGAGSVETLLIEEDDGPNTPASPPTAGAEAVRAPSIVQRYVRGVPMSATFLVDRDGRPHLVGVGRQEVEIRDGRFRYLGGTVPAGDPGLAGEARRAVGAVAGLRGWVGVDFILDEGGRAVILEINPRLTTSFVGLRRLLPAGMLTGAMLDAFDEPGRMPDLARAVHTKAPVTFRADGTIDATVGNP